MKRLAPLAWLVLTAALVVVCYFFIDRPLTLWAAGLPRSIQKWATIITQAGEALWWLIAAAALMLFNLWKRRREAAMIWGVVLGALAFTGLAANLIKLLAGRYRPKMFIEQGLYGFTFPGLGYAAQSFPSGHATTAACLATLLCLLYPRRGWWAMPALALVAFSRLLTRSHYLGDVLAGLLLGAMGTWYFWQFARARGWLNLHQVGSS